ncbi:hypothetical protein TcYC6_0072910 [Trypanosoma cruzi]|nr:hypothetical protein TcYC6_0072910 [Trypanosoma cruzi]
MSAPYKKKNTQNVPCIYFKRGACTNQRCPYLHVRGKELGENADAAPTGNGSTDAATNLLSTMLKLVFEKQQHRVYDASSGMLDLSELRKFPDLKDVSNSINFNTQNFCRALCSSIKSLIVPPPSAMQLKGNDITSFFHFASQMENAGLHLSLRALSLEANDIKTMEALQGLKKFSNLQELVLVGNAVARRDDYRAEVKKAMPFLLGLDGEAIMAPPLSLPWPRFTNSDYTDAQQHVLQFVQCSLLNPLQAGDAAGVPQGVDAVSDFYAQKAILSISLSSPEAAVSTPARTVKSSPVGGTQRNVVREIVSFRLKQTESNHNLLHGVKSSVVACGRTKVCSQLEHWLYPKNFLVEHFVHSSASASFLDNTYLSGPSPAMMKVPVTVVTLHGVMAWTHLSPQNQSSNDRVVIYRNFSRVISVQQNDAGRWLITNDMVSLYPFPGDAASPSKKGDANASTQISLSECRILFSPRDDRSRAEVLGRKKNVPMEVVLALSQHVSNDAELITVLNDIGGVPLSMYEHCATLAGENILESIQVCRIGNRFGLAPEEGLELLRRVGGNWCAVEEAMAAVVGVTPQAS